MGYTHYWERPRELDTQRFERFRRDVARLLDHLPAHTTSAGGYYADATVKVCGADGTGEPIINGLEVVFNGDAAAYHENDGGLHHETFYMPRVLEPHPGQQPDERGRYFDFCKTARKPYDLVVTAALLAFAHHFPAPETLVNSDGDAGEWTAGLALCRRVLGYGELPPSVKAERSGASKSGATIDMSDLPREALQAFPLPSGHNLNSTATHEERRRFIDAALNWWNRYGAQADELGLIDHRNNPRV